MDYLEVNRTKNIAEHLLFTIDSPPNLVPPNKLLVHVDTDFDVNWTKIRAAVNRESESMLGKILIVIYL